MKKYFGIVILFLMVGLPPGHASEDLELQIKMDKASVGKLEEIGLEGEVRNNTDKQIVMVHPRVIGTAQIVLNGLKKRFI